MRPRAPGSCRASRARGSSAPRPDSRRAAASTCASCRSSGAARRWRAARADGGARPGTEAIEEPERSDPAAAGVCARGARRRLLGRPAELARHRREQRVERDRLAQQIGRPSSSARRRYSGVGVQPEISTTGSSPTGAASARSCLEHREAVLARQHQVEQHEIRRSASGGSRGRARRRRPSGRRSPRRAAPWPRSGRDSDRRRRRGLDAPITDPSTRVYRPAEGPELEGNPYWRAVPGRRRRPSAGTGNRASELAASLRRVESRIRAAVPAPYRRASGACGPPCRAGCRNPSTSSRALSDFDGPLERRAAGGPARGRPRRCAPRRR